MWGVPTIRAPFLGVCMIRIIVYSVYLGAPCLRKPPYSLDPKLQSPMLERSYRRLQALNLGLKAPTESQRPSYGGTWMLGVWGGISKAQPKQTDSRYLGVTVLMPQGLQALRPQPQAEKSSYDGPCWRSNAKLVVCFAFPRASSFPVWFIWYLLQKPWTIEVGF